MILSIYFNDKLHFFKTFPAEQLHKIQVSSFVFQLHYSLNAFKQLSRRNITQDLFAETVKLKTILCLYGIFRNIKQSNNSSYVSILTIVKYSNDTQKKKVLKTTGDELYLEVLHYFFSRQICGIDVLLKAIEITYNHG